MKTILRPLFAALLFTAMTGCAAQKANSGDERSRVGHETAEKALDSRMFVIEISEIQFTDGRPAKTPANGYVSLHKDKAVVNFGPDIYFARYYHDSPIHSQSVEMTRKKKSRKGDPQYTLKIEAEEGWQCNEMFIKLFKNTNECFVSLYTNARKENAINFKGYVYPLTPDKHPADN